MKAETTPSTEFCPFEDSITKKDEEEFCPFNDEGNGNSMQLKTKMKRRNISTGLKRSAAKGKRKIKSKRLILYLLLVQAVDQATARCTDSIKSVDTVPRCPGNETEWKERAKLKRCSEIMKHCMDSYEYVYHCLINTHIDQTLEVCAKPIMAHGFCCEFNKRGKVIQIHLKADCKHFSVPCSDSYWSNSSYLYQGCYQLVNEERMRQSTIDIYETTKTYISQTPFFNDGEKIKQTANAFQKLLYVAIPAVIILLLLVLVYILYRLRNHIKKKNPAANGEFIHLSNVVCK